MSAQPPIRPGHTDAEIIRLARRSNRAVFWRTISIISVVLLGVTAYLSANASHDAKTAVNRVQDTQIAGCKASIQPGGVRFIDAQNIARQVVRSDAADINPAAVANAFGISTEQSAALLKEARAEQVDSIHDLLGVECSTGRALPDAGAQVPKLRVLANPQP